MANSTSEVARLFEVLQQQRATTRKHNSQPDALTEDAAQFEEDIAELDTLPEDQQKQLKADADADVKWQEDRKSSDDLQKKQENQPAEAPATLEDAADAMGKATAPPPTPAEVLEQQRAATRKQKSQADALTQDTAQLEKDIAELDTLLKDQQKQLKADADADAKWQKDRTSSDDLQKKQEKQLAEELAARKDKVAAAAADAVAAIAAAEAGLLAACADYEAKQEALASTQAQHDATKAFVAVLKQYQADRLKLKQGINDRQTGRFTLLGKRIDTDAAANPTAAYAGLLLLRAALDGTTPAPAAATAKAAPDGTPDKAPPRPTRMRSTSFGSTWRK